jgi:predicted AAA+ superfamily ATPase
VAALRPRLYDTLLKEHFVRNREMAFVSGPRQVGKTTTCRSEGTDYLNWDSADDRRLILRGPSAMAQRLGADQLRARLPIVVFDELHKHVKWKSFLKGFFDVYGERVRLIVTGSSRLDVFRRGGDSLMGRYFLYRMHPFTVAECLHVATPAAPGRPPMPLPDDEWLALWEHGGFPEPFLRRDPGSPFDGEGCVTIC